MTKGKRRGGTRTLHGVAPAPGGEAAVVAVEPLRSDESADGLAAAPVAGDAVRGRVLARSPQMLLVRTAEGDVKVRIRSAGTTAEPGDLIEIRDRALTVVRSYMRGDYPTPETELARLERGRRRNLVRRGQVMTALRAFFADRDFLEVDTPLLVRAPGLEVHLAAVPAGAGGWLVTSPEYQMKRLLAGGLERIYTVCKCFRAGEDGAHHASEFTMLEWYRAWAGLDAVRADTEALVAAVATAVRGRAVVRVWGREGPRDLDVTPPWPTMTVADAMARFAGVTIDGDEDAVTLRAAVRAAGVDVGTATAWDDVFYAAFVARVEPALAALDRPLFLVDWPVRLAALARRKPGKPSVVERFEVYVGGIELANAFGELTDPVEQMARFEDDRAARADRGLPQYPIDDKLLAALEEGLPPSAGIALGVDRLVMLVCGAARIRDVLTFTAPEL